MGEIKLLVPDDMCVTTDAKVGVGAVNTGGGEQGGIDFDVDESHGVVPGTRELHVIADIGVGHLQIGDSYFSLDGLRTPARPGAPKLETFDNEFESMLSGTNVAACRGETA
jgi:hypothetical protein